MIREVDLVSYLPPFMAGFKEIAVTLESENPEFVLVWKAAERVLQNEFIETADEYGISRFEKILNILPSTTDSLEERRFRVLTRINEELPYTLPQLRNTLETLCGKGNYSAEVMEGTYQLIVKIGLEAKNNFSDVEALLNRVVPQNMVVTLLQLYTTHEELTPYTHSELSTSTHEQLRNEVMN